MKRENSQAVSCYRCQACDRVFPIVSPPGEKPPDEYPCPGCGAVSVLDYNANKIVFKQLLFESGQLRDIWERFVIPSQEQSLQPVLRSIVETWPETPKFIPAPLSLSPKKERKIDRAASLELRKQIWDRDHYICQVCGLKITWGCYECGHMVDRFLGGATDPENLVVMCEWCNKHKPIHSTKDEYLDWLRSGYWKAEMSQEFRLLVTRCHESDLIRKDFNPSDDVLFDNLRFFQMHDMGLIDRYPSLAEQAEWKKNDLFPEWKTHT